MFTAPDNATWMQHGLEVPLQAGANQVALEGSWNYMSVDFLAVEDAQMATAGEGASETGSLRLDAPFPNPTRGGMTIRYSLPSPDHARLDVLDRSGRRVAVLADSMHSAGSHLVPLAAGALAAGVYVVHLTSGSASLSRPLTVVR